MVRVFMVLVFVLMCLRVVGICIGECGSAIVRIRRHPTLMLLVTSRLGFGHRFAGDRLYIGISPSARPGTML